jgi:hypothetical protein
MRSIERSKLLLIKLRKFTYGENRRKRYSKREVKQKARRASATVTRLYNRPKTDNVFVLFDEAGLSCMFPSALN